jgi:hypothetical protein
LCTVLYDVVDRRSHVPTSRRRLNLFIRVDSDPLDHLVSTMTEGNAGAVTPFNYTLYVTNVVAKIRRAGIDVSNIGRSVDSAFGVSGDCVHLPRKYRRHFCCHLQWCCGPLSHGGIGCIRGFSRVGNFWVVGNSILSRISLGRNPLAMWGRTAPVLGDDKQTPISVGRPGTYREISKLANLICSRKNSPDT